MEKTKMKYIALTLATLLALATVAQAAAPKAPASSGAAAGSDVSVDVKTSPDEVVDSVTVDVDPAEGKSK